MITFTLISQDASWAELLSCSMLSFLIRLKSLHHVHTNAQMILQKQILPTVLSNNEGKKRGPGINYSLHFYLRKVLRASEIM